MQPFYRRLYRVALTATALLMLGGCYYYPGYGYYPGYYHPGPGYPAYAAQPGVTYDNGAPAGATTTPLPPDSSPDYGTSPPPNTGATPGYNTYYYGYPGYYGAPYYAGYGYPPPYYYGYGYPYYGYGWGWPFAVGLSFGYYYGGHGGHYHGGGYHGGGHPGHH
jgi:hypothetical protein